jgi:hypothetical protein
MARYRNALSADRARAAQKEDYLENVDPLHTKSGSALQTDMANQLRDQNEAAAGRNAVMGGSGHNTAATKDITSQLMGQYQRSLIRAHEMNIVPQLNYYRSQYDRANAGLEKAEYDKSVANINAASQAAQGMVNAVAAAGSQTGTDATNGTNGNGTKAGAIPELKPKETPIGVILDKTQAGGGMLDQVAVAKDYPFGQVGNLTPAQSGVLPTNPNYPEQIDPTALDPIRRTDPYRPWD